MNICMPNERKESTWQAVNFEYFRLYKEKLTLANNCTECNYLHPPKELTMEALFMIFVITIFIIFAVLGSFNTVYEFLKDENTERKKLTKNTYSKTLTNNLYKKDWIRDSRQYLQCFCFIKNGKRLFQTDYDKDQFACFHGIRVICNIMVMCEHIGKFLIYTRRNAEPFVQSPISKIIFNAVFVIDVLFVLSGFLNAYSFSKAYHKSNGKVCWWHFYLKRFIRLTPTLMIVLGFYTTLICYGGSGPIWPEYRTNPVCKKNWWRYLFYINNFELIAKSCMLWCWYLAVDMQFYIVSPLFLLSLLRRQRFGYVLAIITIFLSSLSCFLITKQYNLIHFNLVELHLYIDDLKNFTDRLLMYGDKLYCKPYSWISSYLIGVLLGYYFHRKNFKDFKNKRITLYFGWIATGILMLICLFSLLIIRASVFERAIYNSVKHIFFSIAISWIIFVCLTGQGKIVNAFLSWKFFLPLSKLSYSTYLIHMLIIKRESQSAQEVEEFSLLSSVYWYLQVIFCTFIFSIPVSLLFEMPVINLFDLYMKKKEVEKSEERKENIKKK